MIIKIQISQNDGGEHVLIYNESRSVMHQFETSEEIKSYMRGAPKGYFHVELVGDKIKILGPAPDQDW